MNWSTQISVAYQLLNNAAVLAVGTLGYCELRRRLQGRLSPWAQELAYGAVFGLFSVLVGFAPAATGTPATLRIAPLLVATLYCGLGSGAVAALIQFAGTLYVLNDERALSTVPVALAWFAVPAIYRLLIPAAARQPRLHDALIVAVAGVCATEVAVAWLWGIPRFVQSFHAIGPAYIVTATFTTVALSAIIDHVEQNDALARAVEENERRFRSFYNESPVMLTAVDREDRIVAASDRWLEVMGYRREDVIGRNRYDFLASASRECMREYAVPALRAGRTLEPLDLQILHKDGGLVEVSVTSVMREDPATGGEILNFAIDQTARREAERALEERESQLRTIVENAPVGIFLKDRESRYRLINGRFEEWVGERAEKIIGRSDSDFLSAELAKEARESDLHALERGEVHQAERQALRPQVPGQYLLVTKFPIRDAAGIITGLAGFAVDITERRRMGQALAERERDLRTVMDNAPFAIFLKDRAGRYRMVNRCYEQWFGRRQEDMEGRTGAEVLPAPLDAFSARADVEVRAGRVVVLERPRASERTTIGHIQVTQFPIRDDRGEIVGSAGFCADITERKRAETALRESEELLVEAQKLGRGGHILIDRIAKRVHWSDSVFEIRGFPPRDSFSFEEAIAFVHPDDRPHYEAARDAAIAEHRDFSVELRILRGDGSYGWEHSIGRPRYDSQGKLTGFLVVLRDVTESKRAEEALKRKEAELRAILDNAPLAIFLKDREGRYRLVNRRYTEWMGRGPEQIYGRTSEEVFPREVAQAMLARDRDVLERGAVSTAEVPTFYFDPKHGIEHALVTKFPVRDDSGAIVGIAGFTLDITARKRAELDLRESQELLLEAQRIGKVGYSVFDIPTGHVRWSDSMFEIRRIPRRDSLTPEEAREFLLPEDRANYLRIRDAAINARRDFEYDARVRRGDGSLAWDHGIGHLRYDAEGNCVSILFVVQDVTESKLAEEALKRKEAELRAIMDNAPFAIFLKDPEGRYRLINRAYTEWFGEPPEEVIGRTNRELYPAEDVEEWDATDREVIETGRVAPREQHVTNARPGTEYVLTTKFPVRDAEGAIIGLAAIVDDITVRKRTQLALVESRRLLLESQRLGKLAYIQSDVANDRVVWSDSLFELRGVPPRAAFTFEEARDFIHPEDRPKYLAVREAAIAERRDLEFDLRVRHGDGSWGWEHSTVHFQFDDAGNCVGSLALVQDVTERKHAEEALRHSEERFRALIERSNDIVTVASRNGTVTYRSPSSREVMGYSDTEIVGQSLFARVHPDDVGAIKKSLASLIGKPSQRAEGRTRVRHQDGNWRTLAWNARDASDVPGIEGIILNSRDVTEALQLEDQLREAQKMEAVGQLAGGIAHDFNNILGAILGFAGFLLQDLPKETPEHGFAERIVAASERGKELVRQILAFSRRSAVERKPTDLAALLEETHQLLRAALPSSTRLDILPPELRLVSDVNAAQISQILFNLCLNANDALQGEPGRIAVELARIEAAEADRVLLGKGAAGGTADDDAGRIVFGSLRLGRAYARIGVSDTGAGMTPEVLKRIFDPFFTTKGRGRGTGLGLSVVHGIVMAYEGAILVTSRPGAGSGFHVYLPLADSLPEAAGRTESPRRLSGRERVLVVDDEPVMTDVITIALDRLGYEAVAINDPEEAIKAVASDPSAWDVVVSDQVMPAMKGISLVERLKAIRPSLRCILCTGFSDGATEEGARVAGVDAFFVKPTAPEDIAAAIRKLFDGAPKASAGSGRSRRRT